MVIGTTQTGHLELRLAVVVFQRVAETFQLSIFLRPSGEEVAQVLSLKVQPLRRGLDIWPDLGKLVRESALYPAFNRCDLVLMSTPL